MSTLAVEIPARAATPLEGDLTLEAIELADREVDALKNANRHDDARAIVRLLPSASLAEHPHLTGVRHAVALADLDRRRLARTVGPEQAVNAADRHREAHAVDRPGLAEVLDQVDGFDRDVLADVLGLSKH